MRNRLGATNLEVFPIAFGTWQLGGEWGDFDDLDNHRDEVVIATKGGLRMTDDGLVRDSTQDSIGAAELSLSKADLERIDRIMAGAVAMSGPAPEMMPE